MSLILSGYVITVESTAPSFPVDRLTTSLFFGLYGSEWLNGMAHGKGIETFADGSVRHDGQWFEDEPVLS